MRAERPSAPCMKCEDRWSYDGVTCHSCCEKYKDYREHLYDVYKERKFNLDVADYEAARRNKINRRLYRKTRR